MPALKSVSRYPTGESVIGSLISVCLGLIVVPFGSYGLRAFWEARQFPGVIGFALVLVFGIVLIHGGVAGGKLFIRLGDTQAYISEPVIEPGDDFHFTFRQDCRGNIRVNSLSFFLVYRERVTYPDGGDSTASHDVDRLVERVDATAGEYRAGESLNYECLFHIPSRKMGVRNPYMNHARLALETMWVVKVCLNINKAEDKVRPTLSKANDIWKEYEVEVSGEPGHYGINTTISPTPMDGKFDVFLVKHNLLARIRHAKIIDPLFPHLDSVQSGEFFGPTPSLLREAVTWEQAQHIQTQLEAIHMQVEIKPAT